MRGLVVPFVKSADDAAVDRKSGTLPAKPDGTPHNVLLEPHEPAKLAAKLNLELPDEGHGKSGLLEAIESILKYSVNTWDQGFMDKLYASNTPV